LAEAHRPLNQIIPLGKRQIMSQCFVIESNDGQRILMAKTADGTIAVPLFRTREAAEAFVAGRSLKNDHARELTAGDIVNWLLTAKKQGATRFALNPPAEGSLSDVPHAPLDAAIMAIDLRVG
jgi:hypothetical protein